MKSIVSTNNVVVASIQQSQTQSNQTPTNHPTTSTSTTTSTKPQTQHIYARTGNAPISTETHRLRRINLAEFCSTLKSSNRGSSNGAVAVLDNSAAVAFAAAASDARRRLDLRDLAARDAGVDDGPPRTGIGGMCDANSNSNSASRSDGSRVLCQSPTNVTPRRRDVDDVPRGRRDDAK